jgi:LPXTG-motif cell wall-anchored protein
MYVGGRGAGAAVVGTGAAMILPNTGGSMIVNVAVALAAGLVTWGIVYVRTH